MRRCQRLGLKLQQQDWFQRRVAECGDDGGQSHLDNQRLQLLVRISPGSEYRGALTPWDAEEQFLLDSLESSGSHGGELQDAVVRSSWASTSEVQRAAVEFFPAHAYIDSRCHCAV